MLFVVRCLMYIVCCVVLDGRCVRCAFGFVVGLVVVCCVLSEVRFVDAGCVLLVVCCRLMIGVAHDCAFPCSLSGVSCGCYVCLSCVVR